MELYAKIVNDWNPVTIFAKSSYLDVWLFSEHASDIGGNMHYICIYICNIL